MNFPAGKGAIISQFRVWPFPSTLIMAFGERNRNPGHHFAGMCLYYLFLFKRYAIKSDAKKIIVR
jgi:hypothetical protein